MDLVDEILREIDRKIREMTKETAKSNDVKDLCSHLTGEKREVCERLLKQIEEARSIEELEEKGFVI